MNETRVRGWLAGTVAVLALASPHALDSRPRAAVQAPAGIEAVVLDGSSDAALSGVRVRIQGTEFATITDPDGRFQFTGVPEGTHRLVADRNGYIPARLHGRTSTGIAGVPVRLRAGQTLNAVLRLYPAASIRGRVIGEDGQPVHGAAVDAYQVIFDDFGRIEHRVAARTRTNDLGRFGFDTLGEGRYGLRFERTRFRGGIPDGMFPWRYYPGTTDADEAILIGTVSGVATELRPVTLREAPGGTLRIEVLGAAASDPSASIRIELRQADEFPILTLGAPLDAIPEIGPLPQGDYRLGIVTSSRRGGARDVSILGGPNTVPIRLFAEARVTGRVVLEDPGADGETTPAAGAAISLSPRARLPRQLFDPSAVSDDQGHFDLEAVPGGEYRVNVDAPPGRYLRGIVNAGGTLVDDRLTLDGGAIDLTVVFGTPGGVVEGVLVNSDGGPVPEGVVVLVPEDPDLAYRLRATTASAEGTYRFPDVAPGDHSLYGWRELPGAAYRNAGFMEEWSGRRRPVVVTPGARVTIDLHVLDHLPEPAPSR